MRRVKLRHWRSKRHFLKKQRKYLRKLRRISKRSKKTKKRKNIKAFRSFNLKQFLISKDFRHEVEITQKE